MDTQNAVCPITEYHSSTQTSELAVHSTTWMHLEDILLRERSQMQINDHVVLFILDIQNWQIHKDRKWISDYQGLGVWSIGMDTRFALG